MIGFQLIYCILFVLSFHLLAVILGDADSHPPKKKKARETNGNSNVSPKEHHKGYHLFAIN